jgi:hypothetical protein
MRRTLLFFAPVAAVIFAAGQTSLAVDPNISVGVGGVGRTAHVTAGWGRASDDGLARPGFPQRTGAGQIGVTQAESRGGLNPGTESGFHVAGMGRLILGGVGRSTMETVPGRTPTYINLVSGTRMAPYMGSRGP